MSIFLKNPTLIGLIDDLEKVWDVEISNELIFIAAGNWGMIVYQVPLY